MTFELSGKKRGQNNKQRIGYHMKTILIMTKNYKVNSFSHFLPREEVVNIFLDVPFVFHFRSFFAILSNGLIVLFPKNTIAIYALRNRNLATFRKQV